MRFEAITLISLAGTLTPAFAADGPAHWAFRPLSNSKPPVAVNPDWVRGALDEFLSTRLAAEGLTPSPEADRRTLIRRLTLDLHGLPPTPEEIRDFLGDEHLLSQERLVDRLLASPRLGERWARHWLDVVRFAETHGFEMNQPRENAWPFRDYVIGAFNEDKPFDRFVEEQIAGDAFGEDAATGFLVGGPWDQVKSPDPRLTAEQRQDELHDLVSTTGSAFLGLTVGCARCHDHKFDPVTQREYFGMQAIFAGVTHGERELDTAGDPARVARLASVRAELQAISRRLGELEPLAEASPLPGAPARRRAVTSQFNLDRFAPVLARVVRFTILQTNSSEPCVDELEVLTADPEHRNVALASLGTRTRASSSYQGVDIHKLEHVNDGRHGNSWSWISGESGKGWVEIELPEATRIDRVVWSRDREEKFKDRVAIDYRIETASTPGGEWTLVASSLDRARDSASPSLELVLEPQVAAEVRRLEERQRILQGDAARLSNRSRIYAGMFGPPGETRLLHRGDPLQPLEVIGPSAIAGLGSPLLLSATSPERQRRQELARWIVSPSNPLTARVIANRVWQHHFGEGIVRTPSDFGRNGILPTHPELLDWLASELLRRDWSLKSLHREILLSSTYRQSSAPRAAAVALDAQSSLLWRFPPRRLEAEAIHDAVLFASGRLDFSMGGPGFSAFIPNDNYVRVYEPKTTYTARDWRRMIYQTKVRMHNDGTFGAFDCPDGGQVCPKRTRSTTPLQSLSLLNSELILEQSMFLAERTQRDVGDDPRLQTRRVFGLVLGREPDAEELAEGSSLARQHGLKAVVRALFNSNEFLFLP